MIHIISRCDKLGHSLSLEGNNIRVENIAGLSDELKKEIVENKLAIIQALENDSKVREIGLLVGRNGLVYMWRVSRQSIAYLEYVNDQWIVWRETYRQDREVATDVKVIVYGNTFDYVLLEFKRYIDFVTKRRDKSI